MIEIEFKDRIVEFPNRYAMADNGDGTYTLTPFPGEVSEVGTPINAANMNTLTNAVRNALVREFRFTSSGAWICPEGVAFADVWCVGGGGSGGASSGPDSDGPGGGGTGGECNLFSVPVNPGQVYEIVVGDAGGYSQFGSASYRSNGGADGAKNSPFGGGCAGGALSTTANGIGGIPQCINPYDGIPYAGGGGAGHASVGGNGGICGGGGGGARLGTGGEGALSYNGFAGGESGSANSESPRGGAGGTNTGAGGGGAGRAASNFNAGGGIGGSGIVIIYYRQILNV